jgi:hypothetical protein
MIFCLTSASDLNHVLLALQKSFDSSVGVTVPTMFEPRKTAERIDRCETDPQCGIPTPSFRECDQPAARSLFSPSFRAPTYLWPHLFPISIARELNSEVKNCTVISCAPPHIWMQRVIHSSCCSDMIPGSPTAWKVTDVLFP